MQTPPLQYRVGIVILLFLTLLFLALAGLLTRNAWLIMTTSAQAQATRVTNCSEDEDGISCNSFYQVNDQDVHLDGWPDLFGDPEHVTIFFDAEHPWEAHSTLIGLWMEPNFCLVAALFCLALLIGKLHINRLVRCTEAEMAEVTMLEE